MQSATPIVLIHKGNSLYLQQTLHQLLQHNSQHKIILLGDKWNKHYCGDGIEHISFHRYKKYATEFRNIFINLSTNGGDYELFCIERWFILYELMLERNFDNAIYLDSDIYVYDDLVKLYHQYAKPNTVSIVKDSAHLNFISSKQVLKDVIDFCFYLFNSEAGREELKLYLEEHFIVEKKRGGGFSDMMLFVKFAQKFPAKAYNLFEEAFKNKHLVDVSFQQSNGFEMLNGYKNAQINKEGGAKINTLDKETFEVKTLHFQGKAKECLAAFITNTDAAFFNKLKWNGYVEKLHKLLFKLSRDKRNQEQLMKAFPAISEEEILQKIKNY